MNKDKSPKLNMKNSSNNPFDSLKPKGIPTLKKRKGGKVDYGKATVEALKKTK